MALGSSISRLPRYAVRTWAEQTARQGIVTMTGTVLNFVPAGTKFIKVLPIDCARFRSINMEKGFSRRDRYVVRVEDDEYGPYRLPLASDIEAGTCP